MLLRTDRQTYRQTFGLTLPDWRGYGGAVIKPYTVTPA